MDITIDLTGTESDAQSVAYALTEIAKKIIEGFTAGIEGDLSWQLYK